MMDAQTHYHPDVLALARAAERAVVDLAMAVVHTPGDRHTYQAMCGLCGVAAQALGRVAELSTTEPEGFVSSDVLVVRALATFTPKEAL
ncbi:hypothetical protein ANRL3_00053 [Anaerolineae bacterium]|nr:hypothetical protein ANRL3_00053 [Anaerolineae bacterium]